MIRRWRILLVLLAVTLGLASCRYDGAQSLPLPGGAGTSGKTYHVTAVFADVTDLVPQSAVRVNDVAVGTVENIRLVGYSAKVTMRVERSENHGTDLYGVFLRIANRNGTTIAAAADRGTFLATDDPGVIAARASRSGSR